VNNDSPQKALLVVFTVALVCSVLVSIATVFLKPLQLQNQLVERSRNIVTLTGLTERGEVLSDDDILEIVEQQLDIRVVNIDTGEFEPTMEPAEFDERAAVNDPERSVAIPVAEDLASLGRRASYAIVYLVWAGDELQRVIMPIHGQGMWSTLYGYLALEADLNTIGAVTFYEQAETAGLGDQILRPDWQAQWRGRRLYDAQGNFRFRISAGTVPEGSTMAQYEVDALTGATVTASAVTRLIAYWFGPNGYGNFLDDLKAQPPVRMVAATGASL
jgi:Na+-transporting NADH:ubiquinone oxidoreductase subunit C